ncbi:MAG: hypothetical protein ACQESR_11555 [Planctomycetota bacterium]
MPLNLQSRNVVIVGAFNPRIILPDWLQKVGIVEPMDTKTEVEFEVGGKDRPGFRFSTGAFRWHVTDSRLKIDSQHENPATLAARVLEHLPHTPLSAVGHNLEYRSESIDGLRLPQIGELNSAALKKEYNKTVRETGWSCRLELAEGVLLNIRAMQRLGTIEVSTNLHREVPDVDKVRMIARGFEEDVSLSNNIVSSMIGEIDEHSH